MPPRSSYVDVPESSEPIKLYQLFQCKAAVVDALNRGRRVFGPVPFLSLQRLAGMSQHRLRPSDGRQLSDQSGHELLSGPNPFVGDCPSFREEAGEMLAASALITNTTENEIFDC
jgi:hypothetical protein